MQQRDVVAKTNGRGDRVLPVVDKANGVRCQSSSSGSSCHFNRVDCDVVPDMEKQPSTPTPASPAEREGGPQCAPFLRKTFEIVEDASTNEIISWSDEGSSFIVWRPSELASELLPLYFKHNNFSSFVRQLNTYGFRKIDPDRWAFANEGFLQSRRDLLHSIQRRKPNTCNITSGIDATLTAAGDAAGPSPPSQHEEMGSLQTEPQEVDEHRGKVAPRQTDHQSVGIVGSSNSAFSRPQVQNPPNERDGKSEVQHKKPATTKNSKRQKTQIRSKASRSESTCPIEDGLIQRKEQNTGERSVDPKNGITRPIPLTLTPTNLLSDLAAQRSLLTQLASEFLELKSENIALKRMLDCNFKGPGSGAERISSNAPLETSLDFSNSASQHIKAEDQEWQGSIGQQSILSRVLTMEHHTAAHERQLRAQETTMSHHVEKTQLLEKQCLVMAQKLAELDNASKQMGAKLQESTAIAERNALDQMLSSVRGILQGMHGQNSSTMNDSAKGHLTGTNHANKS